MIKWTLSNRITHTKASRGASIKMRATFARDPKISEKRISKNYIFTENFALKVKINNI